MTVSVFVPPETLERVAVLDSVVGWAYDVNVYANGIKVSIVSVNNLKGIVAFSYTAKG